MEHFTLLQYTNRPANKLQREALSLLKVESNYLISNPTEFIETLNRKIDELNAANPRCTPLRVYAYDTGKSTAISLGEHFTVHFNIWPVKPF